MAYFHCLIGGGSSGGGYTLTVTCDSQFAGTTITCTDGTTTLTATCPSASPYEVEFEIPNGGDWTISGVVSGQTITTGVSIPTTATLEAIVQKTITIYSAKEDTITYTDIYGDTQTEVFASGQSSKQITVDVIASGSSITFTSGVAKDPSNLSNYYSKTVTIDSNTTDVYVMPENTLFWWGYKDSNLEECTSANGWTYTYTFRTPTYNTYDITLTGISNYYCAVGNKNPLSGTPKTIAQGVTGVSSSYGQIMDGTSKNMPNYSEYLLFDTTSTKLYSLANEMSNGYASILVANARSTKVYAFWVE